jgi:2-polyprenyl-6-hydroxyphenyl methylase/3-demethylubiquinone-9 3-methyltransferase
VLPRDSHDYAKFIKPTELKAMVAAAGLVPRDEKSLRYNPIKKTFGLYNWTGVNYLLAMQRPC